MKLTIAILAFVITGNAAAVTSTWVYNDTKGNIVMCDNCNKVRPIASLTKLMTAIVALEHNSDMSQPVKIGGGSKIPPGITTRGDLFSAMLVRSDNKASEILAEQYPGGRRAFIRAMNAKARLLSLDSMRFVDPSGLSSGNVATVGEVATLIQIAATQPLIADTSVLRQVEVKNRKYRVILDNTNKMLLADFDSIKISKTGYTNASGWSLGVILEHQGQRFVVVVLGAPTKEKRYELAKKLIEKHIEDIEFDVAQTQERQYNSVIVNWILELFGYGRKQ
jgi:D-alanyl-D-alanine endopeptidase (penicillin-binding protein 7)